MPSLVSISKTNCKMTHLLKQKLNYTLWILCYCFPFLVYSQTTSIDSLQSDYKLDAVDSTKATQITGDANYSLTISYFGNMVFHPGLRTNLEKKWKVKHKHKLKSKKRKGEFTLSKSRELVPTTGIGFYIHPRHYGALFVDGGLKFRKSRSKSYKKTIKRWHLGTGMGIYRSFLPETYKVTDDKVKKVFLPGRIYFYPYFEFGLERSWRRNPNHASFFSVNTLFLMPYNTTIMPLLNLQIGYRFKFDKWIK